MAAHLLEGQLGTLSVPSLQFGLTLSFCLCYLLLELHCPVNQYHTPWDKTCCANSSMEPTQHAYTFWQKYKCNGMYALTDLLNTGDHLPEQCNEFGCVQFPYSCYGVSARYCLKLPHSLLNRSQTEFPRDLIFTLFLKIAMHLNFKYRSSIWAAIGHNWCSTLLVFSISPCRAICQELVQRLESSSTLGCFGTYIKGLLLRNHMRNGWEVYTVLIAETSQMNW